MMTNKYQLGIFYGVKNDAEKLAQKFIGHLINDEEYCKACELLETHVKCDHCREHLKTFANIIYFYEKIGENTPDFIEEPESFFPESIPPVDFLLVIGIHQDILAGLPDYLKDKNIKAVIAPIEHPKWIPAGLQVQTLKELEKVGIQAVFPKPFCALSKNTNEHNKEGFHITKKRNYIDEFIDHFKIGEPIVSFILSEDGKSIQDTCVIQSAPCGSTYFIAQQLKAKYIDDPELSLNERMSKAHHSFPCSASMDQDIILKDSILHIGGYLVRNAIRRELNLEEQEGQKLKYVIT